MYISGGSAGVVTLHMPRSSRFMSSRSQSVGLKSPVTDTLLASGANRRNVTVLSAFTCGEVAFCLSKMACCADMPRLTKRAVAANKVFLINICLD